jgi:hypothetical protein
VLGGQSILFAKSFSELVKAAYHGDDGFHHAPTYVIVVALVVCQILQVRRRFVAASSLYFVAAFCCFVASMLSPHACVR